MAEEQALLHSRDGAVLTLTLNRPHRRNAINSDLWAAFGEALTTAANDPGVRALVLTGAGGAFSAGLDLAGAEAGGHPLDVSGSGPGTHPLDEMRRANELALRLHDLPALLRLSPALEEVAGFPGGPTLRAAARTLGQTAQLIGRFGSAVRNRF